jgi:D-3-phosphoglycerate dehydrogenase
MAERFGREPDIELRTVEREKEDEKAWAALSDAHAFQVSSAKDELPKRWFVTDEFLERCPQLLCVSSNGAGYDTVDVPACTARGVLVVNQAGGNAQSVAEQAIGMMIDVTRRISFNDRILRRERGFTREDIMGREMSGKVVGIVGIGHIGTRVARMARAFDMTVLAGRPLSHRRGDRAPRREVGFLRRVAPAIGLRHAALPARQVDDEDDGRGGLREDEEGRGVRHHRSRRHP